MPSASAISTRPPSTLSNLSATFAFERGDFALELGDSRAHLGFELRKSRIHLGFELRKSRIHLGFELRKSRIHLGFELCDSRKHFGFERRHFGFEFGDSHNHRVIDLVNVVNEVGSGRVNVLEDLLLVRGDFRYAASNFVDFADEFRSHIGEVWIVFVSRQSRFPFRLTILRLTAAQLRPHSVSDVERVCDQHKSALNPVKSLSRLGFERVNVAVHPFKFRDRQGMERVDLVDDSDLILGNFMDPTLPLRGCRF